MINIAIFGRVLFNHPAFEMKKYIFFGDEIEGNTPDALLLSMWRGAKFARDEGLNAYMCGVADRIYDYNGMDINIGSVTAFIKDLIEKGLLVELPSLDSTDLTM